MKSEKDIFELAHEVNALMPKMTNAEKNHWNNLIEEFDLKKIKSFCEGIKIYIDVMDLIQKNLETLKNRRMQMKTETSKNRFIVSFRYTGLTISTNKKKGKSIEKAILSSEVPPSEWSLKSAIKLCEKFKNGNGTNPEYFDKVIWYDSQIKRIESQINQWNNNRNK